MYSVLTEILLGMLLVAASGVLVYAPLWLSLPEPE
jgi:hypothetical protein